MSNPDSPIRLITDEMAKPGGLALGFFGATLSIVAIFILPQWTVPAQWLVVSLIILLGTFWLAASAIQEIGSRLSEALDKIRRLEDAGASRSPRVIQSMIDPDNKDEVILLLEPNRLFGQAMLVSIYYESDRKFELLVAQGKVSNVQTNGLIQISVSKWEESHSDIKLNIFSQNSLALSQLLVRPAPTTGNGVEQSNIFLSALLENLNRTNNDGRHL